VTRPVRRASDIHLAALDIRRAGEQLMHPCGCNGKPHTLAEHLWRSTKDMEPSIRASNTDPKVGGSSTDGEGDTDTDPTISVSLHYRQLVQAVHSAALLLTDFVAAHRPDRIITVTPPINDDIWCRAHLRAGLCEPRFRDEPLCRWCHDFYLAYKLDPPIGLLLHRHQVGKVKDTEVVAAVKAERAAIRAAKRNKRKAS
jgi:hypothetical protein